MIMFFEQYYNKKSHFMEIFLQMKIKNKWIIWSAYGYLLFPFIIFCIGFLKPYFGIPISLFVIILFFRKVCKSIDDSEVLVTRKDLLFSTILILLWVSLSGIGGLMFQNRDFHIRNAIFRDLIISDWPVMYSGIPGSTFPPQNGISYTLVYYLGYWLPSALIGKLTNWNLANYALYIWTSIGVFITAVIIKKKNHRSLILATLLMIFFSGMDIIGIGLNDAIMKTSIIDLLPPISHLEWWAYKFQFSSMTTQLFWVFNQAIPAWICTALFLTIEKREHFWLIWSLCFFYAPLPSLGLFPFMMIDLVFPSNFAEGIVFKQKNPLVWITHFLRVSIKRMFSSIQNWQTLPAVFIFLVTFCFYSLNKNSSSIRILELGNVIYLIFLIIFIPAEWFTLWYFLGGKNRKNAQYYIVALVLLLCPLIQIGNQFDFCMRVSIPALFCLMVWSSQELFIFNNKVGIVVTLIFLIGAVTPLYEINRSIYRTIHYYSNASANENNIPISPQEAAYLNPMPHEDHPSTLVADDFISLSNFRPDQMSNFLGSVDNPFFTILFTNK